MYKTRIFAAFAGVLMGLPCVSHAAYPVYQNYQGAGMPTNGVTAVPQHAVVVPQNGTMVYLPSNNGNGVVVANSSAAANPTRVTGQLPKVGSSKTVAGRQYYQPADYERLADSGLYIGLSAGYSASVSGSIGADYIGETNSFFAPGAFDKASWKHDTVIPLQISLGAAINSDLRVDFSYTRYSDISYPDIVQTSQGPDLPTIAASATGGAITSNVAMLNIYYNIDSYTGFLAGGMLRPYIGAGVGVALNTIADYVILDNTFYSEALPEVSPAGTLTGISDIYAYHNGGTTENLAFMLEGGISTDLSEGLKLDLFVRYSNLGKVKTSGSIVVSQTEWLSDGSLTTTGEYEAPYDSVFHYTNWYESGRLSTIDVGARLRLQF